MKIKVFRHIPEKNVSRYDLFDIEPEPGMTVLSALFHIHDNLDASLSFRYSCRGAVCGTCAMLINKVPRLACKTQIIKILEGTDQITLELYKAIEDGETWNPQEEILVEPLPHFPIIKDLIVDMTKFFKFYQAVEPVFKPENQLPQRERRMEPSLVKELENYTNCILCATCFGACPVNGKNSDYLGPAALAKLYRFHIDSREKDHTSRLLAANFTDGWWACEFYTNCRKVCPKGVPPNLAIGKARKLLQNIGKKPDSKKK
jgi:succinate dehydrogenase / fumarate reductase iron-sulfur subunit